MQQVFRDLQSTVVEQAGVIASERKVDGTPVTKIDVEAESYIRAELSRRFPALVHFGEESGYPNDLPSQCWLIDSVDGTKSYIKNIPAYTGMAVLIENGVATASVIYDYARNDMYVAQLGQGAYKNGERLQLAGKPMPTIAYCRERMVDQVNKMLMESGQNVHCEAGPSGAGYGFVQVVEGLAAARFNFPHSIGSGHIHDYAPGALLVQEAGGVVIAVDETKTYKLQTQSFVACHPSLAKFIDKNVHRLQEIEQSTLV